MPVIDENIKDIVELKKQAEEALIKIKEQRKMEI